MQARQYELNTQLDLENGKVEDVDLNFKKEEQDKDDIEKSEVDKHVAEPESAYRTDKEDRCR